MGIAAEAERSLDKRGRLVEATFWRLACMGALIRHRGRDAWFDGSRMSTRASQPPRLSTISSLCVERSCVDVEDTEPKKEQISQENQDREQHVEIRVMK